MVRIVLYMNDDGGDGNDDDERRSLFVRVLNVHHLRCNVRLQQQLVSLYAFVSVWLLLL